MAIHERVYTRLAAPPRKRSTLPALSISRYGARQATRGILTKIVYFGAFTPAIFFAFFIYGISRNQEMLLGVIGGVGIGRFDSIDQVPAETIYQAGSAMTWTMLEIQGWFAIFLTALVGAPQIADDMRSHAFEVYLARPIKRTDYLLGKLLVVMRPVLTIMVLPVILVLVISNALIPETFQGTWPLYPRALAVAVIWAAVNGLVILGISSMGKSARYASVIWFVLTVGTFIVAGILQQTTGDPAFDLASYKHNIYIVVVNILGSDQLSQFAQTTGDEDMLPLLDTSGSVLPSVAVLAGLGALSAWLIIRRLTPGRLP